MYPGTLLLTRKEVASLLTIGECMDAVEHAFKLRAVGKADVPGILGIRTQDGGFHIKAGILYLQRPYFVAKTNANFPNNRSCHGLPTIQGIISVSHASDGRLLALMDSIEITIIRTGAATGIAAKYLSREDAETATIIGCGNQGRISLRALMKVRALKKVFIYDINDSMADSFIEELSNEFPNLIQKTPDIRRAVGKSDICVTCTPSRKYFLKREFVMPGAFIAAVGSDSEDKQELDPTLLSLHTVVTDSVDQCERIGEVHHAINKGMKRDHVYAELGEVISGCKRGRSSAEEIIIFDSTGTALQDVAAAAIVYEKAVNLPDVRKIQFEE
jgi:alanine dehydrogenase